MSDDVLSRVKQQSIYPDDLMAEISQTRLGKPLLISTIVHAVFLLVTSIGFIHLCVKYDTLQPRAAVEAEKRAEKEREKAAAVAASKAQPGAKPEAAAVTPGADPGADPGVSTEPAGTDTGKSPIEQAIEEKSTDFPEKSNVGFKNIDTLDE